MNKDTQQLFDAPWGVGVCEKGNPEFESVFIASKTGCLIGRDMEEETANRLVHLPELYDALEDAAERVCKKCVAFWFPGQKFDFPQNFADFICPITKAGCFCENWLNLLKKVRDGE